MIPGPIRLVSGRVGACFLPGALGDADAERPSTGPRGRLRGRGERDQGASLRRLSQNDPAR